MNKKPNRYSHGRLRYWKNVLIGKLILLLIKKLNDMTKRVKRYNNVFQYKKKKQCMNERTRKKNSSMLYYFPGVFLDSCHDFY